MNQGDIKNNPHTDYISYSDNIPIKVEPQSFPIGASVAFKWLKEGTFMILFYIFFFIFIFIPTLIFSPLIFIYHWNNHKLGLTKKVSAGSLGLAGEMMLIFFVAFLIFFGPFVKAYEFLNHSLAIKPNDPRDVGLDTE